MTLTESLLAKVSEWRPVGSGRHALSAAADGWTAHLAADKADALACLVWELSLARTGDAPAGLTLKAWAEGVAARATGLMEPLKVLEVDDARGEALLRSESPATKGERVAYYEVRLFGLTRATAQRFAAARPRSEVANASERGVGEGKASGREQVPFALTHEVLAKLAGDIAG